MIAIIPVRDGVLPIGADEAVADADGRALVIGSGTAPAAGALCTLRRGWRAEAGDYAPGAWASGLGDLLARSSSPVAGQDRDSGVVMGNRGIVLPGSADGRDLAPRLAFLLGVPLLAGAIEVTARGTVLARWDTRVLDEVEVDGTFVATLLPGARAVRPAGGTPEVDELPWQNGSTVDAEVVEVLPPDPRTADLAEAPRILGAGAGLTRGAEPTGAEAVALLRRLGEALSASVGATRVVTDAGFADYRRQIGTTGVVVDPELYIAFGISGAAQHIGGLGAPRHVVSVNTDPSCPMTAMADLGIVTDATALLVELAGRLAAKEDARG